MQVIHRLANKHRTHRIREAQLAGTRTTVHTFYQLTEAPAEETGVSYKHSSLEPPCRTMKSTRGPGQTAPRSEGTRKKE
eukprot:1822557-Prymnesium_polylepis.1